MTLEKQLSNGVRKFSFVKKDGSTRIALGTTNTKIINAALGSKRPSNGVSSRSPNVTTYFDMEAQAFRCFITDNFKEFLDVENVDEETLF